MTTAARASDLTIGMVMFPDMTHLDLAGPYDVFSRMPKTQVHLLAATLAPVRAEGGWTTIPQVAFDDAPACDVICVPGGIGVNAMMEDAPVLRFLDRQARTARSMTSVCTGALVLGAAGLLRGYRATTHWLSLDLLPLFGAHVVEERVVVDRDRITGAGVTAGIDFGLVVASQLLGADVARAIQLAIEYDPAPPFGGGSPASAAPALVERLTLMRAQAQAERRTIAERAARQIDGLAPDS
jgi:cyclohexyl-isocyanide hydratase